LDLVIFISGDRVAEEGPQRLRCEMHVKNNLSGNLGLGEWFAWHLSQSRETFV
jgi:hypothetical protein